MPPRHHRTIDRVAMILDLAAGKPEGVTISEAAKEIGAPISSIQGFVNGLVAAGYLDEDARRYRIGPAPYILTLRANRNPARTVQHADLEEIHQKTGCRVLLAIRVGDYLLYVDEAHGARPLSRWLLSQKRSLLNTVAGHVFLSRLPPNEMDAYLAKESDERQLERILDEVTAARRDGILVRLESWIPDAGGSVGMAVEDANGQTVGVVVVNHRREELEPKLKKVVAALEKARAMWATRS